MFIAALGLSRFKQLYILLYILVYIYIYIYIYIYTEIKLVRAKSMMQRLNIDGHASRVSVIITV